MAGPSLAGRSLLVVFAHPDDESIACGGLIAQCAIMGARVVILCLTRGENCSGTCDSALSAARTQELTDAALVLGVDEVVLLDYPDGFLPWVPEEELQRRIQDEIVRVAPDVVVTFGNDGLYWHPDHIAVHERTTAAIQTLSVTPPALYYVTIPPGAMRAIVTEHGGTDGVSDAMSPLLGIANPDAFGVAALPPTLVLRFTESAGRKLAALQCHRSQVAGGAFARIAAQDAARLLGTEYFHRAAVGSSGHAFIEDLQ